MATTVIIGNGHDYISYKHWIALPLTSVLVQRQIEEKE